MAKETDFSRCPDCNCLLDRHLEKAKRLKGYNAYCFVCKKWIPIKERVKYPDRELIKRLRAKFLEYTFDSLTKDEAIDLINHQHELISDLERGKDNG